MSKCLSQLELPYDTMKSAFEDNIDDRQAFYDHLKGAGINRKVWRKEFGITFVSESASLELSLQWLL